ncbi:hypothetical protein MJ575_21815 [Klebsiella pneumoniae]|nr:hypothetical protein MJ575_21815 [Klebsiella pneumoniae]
MLQASLLESGGRPVTRTVKQPRLARRGGAASARNLR